MCLGDIQDIRRLLQNSGADPQVIGLGGLTPEEVKCKPRTQDSTLDEARPPCSRVKLGMVVKLAKEQKDKLREIVRETASLTDWLNKGTLFHHDLHCIPSPDTADDEVLCKFISAGKEEHFTFPLDCVVIQGHKYFADFLQELHKRNKKHGRASASASSTTPLPPEHLAQKASQKQTTRPCDFFGSALNLNDVLQAPLPDNRKYRSAELLSGCLIHFVVDGVLNKDLRLVDLECVLQSGAGVFDDHVLYVNARAYFTDQQHLLCSVTSLHLAAFGGCSDCVARLLEASASVETCCVVQPVLKLCGFPDWTPLADAVLGSCMTLPASSTPSAACRLLEGMADPDSGVGCLSCLHLAVVKNADKEVVKVLIDNKADVTLKTSSLIRGSEAYTHVGIPSGIAVSHPLNFVTVPTLRIRMNREVNSWLYSLLRSMDMAPFYTIFIKLLL
ncbi:unnamed protein product [Polarella glacialis]|uniref:Uncharacterized protein n=1 Tax=Polarella glacialis TaxID=89957 RepID=A0A813JDD2_POLGL|nr:unnamed protein product [Polarella glacialis]CAE8672175.1 unnamed protein product [Polarella glacialis]